MVNIKRQIVPGSIASRVTYGNGNKKRTVTVHQTGNTSRGAGAQAHANLQSNGNARNASWHYQVDDKEIIQSFEDDAQCFHAGDGRGNGNLHSVSVEICINSDADYRKSVENGAKLVKHLLDKHGLSINDVKQHYDWSRKNCPAQIRANKDGISWEDFLNMVEGVKVAPAPKQETKSVTTKGKSISQMADEVIAGKHGSGHANRRKSLGISQAEYEKVRAEVNRRAGISTPKPKGKSIAQMAQEVIDGKHGNGHEARRKSLGISKTEYEKVRSEVNRQLTGKRPSPIPSMPRKSISQMATEVIRGDHGTGHETRRKSLGISKSDYEKVRAEVNRRL